MPVSGWDGQGGEAITIIDKSAVREEQGKRYKETEEKMRGMEKSVADMETKKLTVNEEIAKKHEIAHHNLNVRSEHIVKLEEKLNKEQIKLTSDINIHNEEVIIHRDYINNKNIEIDNKITSLKTSTNRYEKLNLELDSIKSEYYIKLNVVNKRDDELDKDREQLIAGEIEYKNRLKRFDTIKDELNKIKGDIERRFSDLSARDTELRNMRDGIDADIDNFKKEKGEILGLRKDCEQYMSRSTDITRNVQYCKKWESRLVQKENEGDVLMRAAKKKMNEAKHMLAIANEVNKRIVNEAKKKNVNKGV